MPVGLVGGAQTLDHIEDVRVPLVNVRDALDSASIWRSAKSFGSFHKLHALSVMVLEA